ncbi:hypothetical protein [Ramlibacter henchirensis]|uniref:hypothetical protein n=1 Tax=Ramlibacter henchirensis TaxID=204072 RepID=UPI001432246F|nr:hypothetical protein [Ramlibacter henchirensis]
MKRDLPDQVVRPEKRHEPSRSMLASRSFWIGGLLSLVVWALLIYALYTFFL